MKDQRFIGLMLEKAFKDSPALTKKEFRGNFKLLGKETADALFDFISSTAYVEKKQRGRIRLKNPFQFI